jgi:NAD+ kinase
MRSIPRKGQTNEDRCLETELLDPDLDAETHCPEGDPTVVLNEIVVDRGPNPTMSIIELYANDEFLTPIAADGVCVATPTGSTAYSLAAGGSLCHPALPGMLVGSSFSICPKSYLTSRVQVTVICAHALTFRPLILPDSMVLRVGVPYNARNSSWVSFDGKKRTELHQGDYVTIVTSQYPLPTVQYRMDNMDWFDSIRRTMNWGDRVQQKPIS